MLKKIKFLAAALLVVAHQAASAIEFKVNSYTGNSVTFTLSGTMPGTAPSTLRDGPAEIGLLYTGDLWSGAKGEQINALSAAPIAGAGELLAGYTGGYRTTPYNYSWLFFTNDLSGLACTGTAVTLTWDGSNFLNTSGTGTIDLYWGNLVQGPEPQTVGNVLLGSVSVVDGRVIGGDAAADPGTGVPEPASLALFGISALGLAAARRRKQRA